MVGQIGRVTSKGNEAKSKMKISYAHAEIQTQVVMIWDLTSYQLDYYEGDKDNNYVFVILLIHTLTQYKYIIINSLSGNKLLVMSTIWPGIFFLWLLRW